MQAELCYCFWHHHIGQKNSFRLKKILSCFLHFFYFLTEHAVANKHFKQNFFFLIKSNSETQQNHEPEWTQPVLSTVLNRIHHLNFLFFTSKSLQLLHVSPQSFKAEVGFYQAVTKIIILHFKFLDFASAEFWYAGGSDGKQLATAHCVLQQYLEADMGRWELQKNKNRGLLLTFLSENTFSSSFPHNSEQKKLLHCLWEIPVFI